MLIINNPNKQTLDRIRTFVKKNHVIVPLQLTDGRYAVPDIVLTDPAFAQYADLIRSYTTQVPDSSVSVKIDPPPGSTGSTGSTFHPEEPPRPPQIPPGPNPP